MRVICGIGQLGKPLLKTVAAVGVFDGVHLGHQRVIAHAVAEARASGGESVVVTFHPHPVSVLYPDKFSAYLTTMSQRLERFSALGVSTCLVVRFTRQFARMAPERFVARYLAEGLGVVKVVVGKDFHFGRAQGGSLPLLENLGLGNGFEVISESLLLRNNKRIKSSVIRDRVAKGFLEEAQLLLGRPHVLRGTVVRGDGRGKALGYPTANIEKENVVLPPEGIYLARVILRGCRHNAMVYIGRRPSFKSARARVVLEAHILDFKKNLYGQEIDLEMLVRLRDDIRFSDKQQLILQIRQDECQAREWFARRVPVLA